MSSCATGSSGKPLLGILGFLARGNSGDEAILQCIYETFAASFDIVLVVDETEARQGYWDWYPYNECQRVHIGDIHFFEKRLAGLLVGGGGLGLGYGAAQVLVAKGAGTPVVLAGVDHPHEQHASLAFAAATSAYLRLFDFVAMRSAKAVAYAALGGTPVFHGADWALKLAADESVDVKPNQDGALIVLREFAEQLVDTEHCREQMMALLDGLKSAGYVPSFLAFCPQDESFLERLGLKETAPVLTDWWNPRRQKQAILNAGLLISVGRLHPMIYAAGCGTPNFQLQPPLTKRPIDFSFGKMRDMAEELGVPYYADVPGALDALSTVAATAVSNRALVQAARGRLDQMTRRIHQLFLTCDPAQNLR